MTVNVTPELRLIQCVPVTQCTSVVTLIPVFGKITLGTILTAWLLFIVAFFLPATNVMQVAGTSPGTPLTGWQAFRASLECLAASPLVWFAEPRSLLLLAFPIGNQLMLIAPWLVFANRGQLELLTLAFAFFAILPWFLSKGLTGDLYSGFLIWNAAFVLMSAGCILKLVQQTISER